MTKTADLFIFGKLDGIYQSVKITPLKKLRQMRLSFIQVTRRWIWMSAFGSL